MERLSYAEFLRALPKVELHCHLLGAMRPETCAALAAAKGIRLPAAPAAVYSNIDSKPPDNDLYRHTRIPMTPPAEPRPDPAYSLLEVSRWFAAVLREPADFERVLFEAAEDLATTSSVRHCEIFFEPMLYARHGTPYEVVAAGLTAGVERVEGELGITCRLIPAIDRSAPAEDAVDLVRTIVRHRHPAVVGIGLEDFELAGPPERFADAYRIARDAGLHRTAHAAEHDPSARNVVTCLDVLGCERIDHGYFVLEDDTVVARCREEAVSFTCITTTSRRAWRPWRQASIRAMIEAGLRVVLGSDDPAMFPTTLADEYVRVGVDLGVEAARMARMCLDAVDACWLEPGLRSRLRQHVEGETAALLRRLTPSSASEGAL